MKPDGIGSTSHLSPPGSGTTVPLTEQELVSGAVGGMFPRHTPELDSGRRSIESDPISPLHALEQAVLPALLRPPCLVSFSGGMDSTLVLAVALRAAGRHGLPPPIPVSWRFPQVPRADESALQDALLAELAVPERLILAAADELDLIGPVASRILARYGVLNPANLHLHLPILDRARGGSLLTGLGGDQVLSSWRAQRWPASGAAVGGLWRALPATVRSRVPRPDHPVAGHYPWLRPAAARRAASRARQRLLSGPARPDQSLRWQLRRRELMTARHNLDVVAADADVLALHPLLDHRLHASLLAAVPARVRLRRAEIIGVISDGQLPAVLAHRRAKARFRAVFVGGPAIEFVKHWDGTGIDFPSVDVTVLRRLWAAGRVPGGTEFLAQLVRSQQLRRASGLPTDDENAC